MGRVQQPNILFLVGLTGIGFLIAGCISVDTIRLTNKNFPPKDSVQEVEVIDREPPCAFIRLAQLSVDNSDSSYESEQAAILKKASKLGADAVIFHHGIQRTKTVIAPGGYRGMYGYPGWGYGPYGIGGYGYGPMMPPMPYDMTLRSLTGIAIRFTDQDDRKC